MKSPSNSPVEVWGGMECTINRVGNDYFDQLDLSGHRVRENDIALFASLGLNKMRYPLLWEYHQPSEETPVNWAQTEKRLNELRAQGIGVIAGLVHHGSGPPFVQITDETFAAGLAQYAAQVAKRFPWIAYYTPVNEPLTTARFCGLYGLWYPHERNDTAFCRILVNECRATVMSMAAIRVYNPSAKLIQTDDLGRTHSSPALAYQAEFENGRRWLSFDLLAGKVNADHSFWPYLTDHGIAVEELQYFINNPCPPDILGINYYLTSERFLDEAITQYPAHTHGGNGRHVYADVEAVRVSDARPAGLQNILKEAWDRYRIPLAVTEVHLHCTREEQMRWLNEAWHSAKRLKKTGVDVVAITPWALLGAFGWDRLLTLSPGSYEPGVFDLSGGQPRRTILADMIRAFSRQVAFNHPVLDSPGWWRRGCRVIFGPERHLAAVLPVNKPLCISGKYASQMAQVCSKRCLNYILTAGSSPDIDIIQGDAWATIEVNDQLKVRTPGRPDLVIRFDAAADIRDVLNKALDLFLDEEHGNWQVGPGCVPAGEFTVAARLHHFLAS